MHKTRKIVISLLATGAIALTAGGIEAQQQQRRPAQSQAQTQRPAQQRNVVVHLTEDSGDLHAVMMALDMAMALQSGGANVVLFLDLEGVRLADKRLPNQVTWGTSGQTLAQRYSRFVNAGGRVLLCAHCAENANLTQGNLRDGARIATPQQLATVILDAEQVIDY